MKQNKTARPSNNWYPQTIRSALNSQLDVEYIAKSLGKALRNGKGWRCLCPAHDDHNPSLSIALGESHELLVHCFTGCSYESVIDALQYRSLVPRRDHREDKDYASLQREQQDTTKSKPANEINNFHLHLWARSEPPQHTAVEIYLDERLAPRGLTHIPDSLRYLRDKHTQTNTHWPCMIAAVMYFSNCQPIGIHRTYLREDGTDKAPINPQKKMLRSIKGGGVWLGVPSQYLIIAEGIETALTCQLMYGMSAVAALSSTNMQHLILPSLPLARTIFIAQDNDDAGRKATEQLANRLYEEGRTVKILTPPPTYNDFNDILQCKQNTESSAKDSVNQFPSGE